MKEDMEKVWSVFASKEDDSVKIDELVTIMRALDVQLPDEESVEEVRKMIDPNCTGFITFPGLVTVMEEKLLKG